MPVEITADQTRCHDRLNSDLMIDEVIDFIESHDMCTADAADAQRRQGVLPRVMPLNRGHRALGRPHVLYAHDGFNASLRHALHEVPEQSIVFAQGFRCDGEALLGEKICRYLFEVVKIKALVVNGLVRDAHFIYRENWPVWALGITPRGCSVEPCDPLPKEDIQPILDKLSRSVLICDDNGAVLIPQPNRAFLKNLSRIKRREELFDELLAQGKPPVLTKAPEGPAQP